MRKTRKIFVNGTAVIFYSLGAVQVMSNNYARIERVKAYLIAEGFVDENFVAK